MILSAGPTASNTRGDERWGQVMMKNRTIVACSLAIRGPLVEDSEKFSQNLQYYDYRAVLFANSKHEQWLPSYKKFQAYTPLQKSLTDFWAMIPFNFERLQHYHSQSNRKSNVTDVLEKDESFKWGAFPQDLSYHSNGGNDAIPHSHKNE